MAKSKGKSGNGTADPTAATEAPAAITATMSARSTQQSLRYAVRHFYDLQVLRSQYHNRYCEKVSRKEGAVPIPIQLTPGDKERMEEGEARLRALEAKAFEVVEGLLNTVPFYVDVLKKPDPRWKGLGPTMAAVILSEVDIERATTVSKLWRYAGLAPVAAWRCRSCHRLATRVEGGWEHARKKANEKRCDRETDTLREGQVYDSGKVEKPVKGEKRHYNLFLKTKLLGVLAGSFLRLNNGADEAREKSFGSEVWLPVYTGYKHRLESSGRATSPGQLNRAALRYMIKMFLIELWKEWRTYMGLPVRPPYNEEKLGHIHAAWRSKRASDEETPTVDERAKWDETPKEVERAKA